MSSTDRTRFIVAGVLGLALTRCQYDVVFDHPDSSSPDGSAGDAGDWIETSAPPGEFIPREQAAYVSTGNQLFVWGGLDAGGAPLDSGAIYDPRTDTWTMVATDPNTPSPRSNATAVWTGSLVVVWGGFDPDPGRALGDGAIYSPVEDAWQRMESAEIARSAAVGAYLDGRAIFWGGHGDTGEPIGGLGIYDPGSGTWRTPTLGPDDPGALDGAAVAVSDDALWISGGRTQDGTNDSSGTYSASDSFGWAGIPPSPLTPRWGAFAAFVDLEFHLWGGRDQNQNLADGAVFDIGEHRGWWPPNQRRVPSARYRSHRESGWAFGVGRLIFLVGGLDAPEAYLNDGGIYDATGDGNGWTAIPAWPGSASHAFGVADWVADQLVVWGGRDGSSLTNGGARYLP